MFGRCAMGDDLRIWAAAIAVTMVAIMMRVDDGIYALGGAFGVLISGQHIQGERHIEQSVDQQRLIAIDDQPGV